MENRVHRVAGVLLVLLYGVMWMFIAWQPQGLGPGSRAVTPPVPLPPSASVACAERRAPSASPASMRAHRNLFEFSSLQETDRLAETAGDGASRRRSSGATGARAPASGAGPGRPEGAISFQGTIRMDGVMHAVLWLGGRTRVVKVGDVLEGGWIVRRIERMRVQLEDARGVRFWIGHRR